MGYEPEKMTPEVMANLINLAYNEVTFRNALVCALDWCNWYRCTHIHADSAEYLDSDGYRVNKHQQINESWKYQLTEDTVVDMSKAYFEYDNQKKKYYKVTPSGEEDPSEEGWYEYVNPSEQTEPTLWYVKNKFTYSYTEINESKISYHDSPYANEWYVLENNEYVRSRDNYPTGNMSVVTNIDPTKIPRDEEWLELKENGYEKIYVENYFNPAEESWYEYDSQTQGYFLTTDAFYVPTKTYYRLYGEDDYEEVVINPSLLGWYEYDSNNNTYVLTEDTTVDFSKDYFDYMLETYFVSYDLSPVAGKTYYICDYIAYYKQIRRNEVTYTHTTDTIVNPNTKYFYKKLRDEEEPVSLPDYSDHYVRNIDITVKGVYDEITLNNKRPVI